MDNIWSYLVTWYKLNVEIVQFSSFCFKICFCRQIVSQIGKKVLVLKSVDKNWISSYCRQDIKMGNHLWNLNWMTGRNFIQNLNKIVQNYEQNLNKKCWESEDLKMLISRSAEDPMFHLRLSLQNQKARKWVEISLNLKNNVLTTMFWQKCFDNNVLTTMSHIAVWSKTLQVEGKAEAEEKRGAEEKFNSLLRFLSHCVSFKFCPTEKIGLFSWEFSLLLCSV